MTWNLGLLVLLEAIAPQAFPALDRIQTEDSSEQQGAQGRRLLEMAEAPEAPHSDSTVEVAGFTASPDIMTSEMMIVEEQPEFVIYHTETVSEVQDQTDPSETVDSEIVILEEQSVFICQDEALSDLDQFYLLGKKPQFLSQGPSFSLSFPILQEAHQGLLMKPPVPDLKPSRPRAKTDLSWQISRMSSLESGNSGIFILENQAEILIYQHEALLAVQDQLDPAESEIPGIILEEQPEVYIYYVEPLSDPQDQMDLSEPMNRQIIIVEDHSEVCISHDESPSEVQAQMQLPGEASFQLMHQGSAPISPADHNRHFPDTDHAPMLRDSENKDSDPGEAGFSYLNHRFASLIQSRRRRFNRLPSTARRKLTYDS
ncbi:uncharacterized protein ACOB8E_009638 [Sarcophilus harrisii]